MRKFVILCVDDERFVLSVIKEQLLRQFADTFVVETVESGEEALEVLAELEQDGNIVPVLITDQMMPGMRGDELLLAVQARSPRTRSILLTGQASMDVISAALSAGRLYRYVAKPWRETDLLQTVRGALSSWREAQESGLFKGDDAAGVAQVSDHAAGVTPPRSHR